MFEVIEFRRARTTKAKVAKFTRKKVIREFPTLEAARKFVEGKNEMIIQFSRKFIKDMNA